MELVGRWARLDPFKPSREQLMRYQGVMGRVIPTKWDKQEGRRKPTMDEKALRKLSGVFPDDPVYKGTLQLRSLGKLAGTYIGYPNE